MIKFIKSSKTGGDETSAYDIKTDNNTIGEFINEVLQTRKNEWGKFKIGNVWGPSFEYKYGKLLTEIPESILNKSIGIIQASGGWSNMDYYFK